MEEKELGRKAALGKLWSDSPVQEPVLSYAENSPFSASVQYDNGSGSKGK